MTARLQRVLDALVVSPAIIKTATWDVVAWNHAAAMLLTDVVLEVDAACAGEQRTRGRENDRAGILARRLLADRQIDDRLARRIDQPHAPERRLARRAVQLGADDDAWVHGVAADAVRRPAPVELDGEQHVGGLRLRIGGARIVSVDEVGIVSSDAAEPLGSRGDVDDASAVRGAQCGQQGRRQLEVAEMISRELRLKPARIALRTAGSPRAIHQDRDGRARLGERL